MTRTYVQPGNTIDAVAPGPGGVTTGVPVLIGNLFGIPELTAAAGAPFALNLTGVHRLPKAARELQAGALAYWDADPGTVVATTSTNYLLAAVAEHADMNSPTVLVRLNGTTTVAAT